MNKREIVKEIQKLVLVVYDDDAKMDNEWRRKVVEINEAKEQLTPSELEWANNAYEKWFNSNEAIQKAIKNIKEE